MSPARFSASLVRATRSRRRWSRFFARAALASAVGPIVAAIVAGVLDRLGVDSIGFALTAWLVGWLVLTPLSSVAALIAGSRFGLGADTIEVTDDELRLTGARAPRIIPLGAVEGALSVMGNEDEVEIVLAGGDVLRLSLPNREAPAELVSALGFGADARRTVLTTGDDHAALSAGCWGVFHGSLLTVVATCGLAALASSVRPIGQILGYLIAGIFVGASVLIAKLLAPRRIVVGTDGILVEKAFRRLFIPLSSVRHVQTDHRGVVTVVTPPAGSKAGERVIRLTSDTSRRAVALEQRIQDALALARPGSLEAPSALIARGGRSIAEWREGLRRLVAGEGGYRGERVSIDALLRAAESPEAPVEQRVGAALAIGMSEDGEARKKLRIAVEGIADDTLRAAMDRAAEGEEDAAAIEEALAAEKKAVVR